MISATKTSPERILMKRLLVVLGLVLAPLWVAAASAPVASAATEITIGQTILEPSWTTYTGYPGGWGVPGVFNITPDSYWGSKFVVPQGNWVVTSWSTRSWGGSMRMMIFRPLGPDSYAVVGQSDTETLGTDHGTARFTLDPGIPVQTGDILGAWFGQNTGAYHDLNGGFDAVRTAAAANPPNTGSTVTYAWSLGNEILVISATLEAAVADNMPPLVSSVTATPNPAALNTASTLTATIGDATTGGSNVSSAEYSIDGSGWQPMTAADGSFDSPTEAVTATLPAGVSVGAHTVSVRGSDAVGNVSDGTASVTYFVQYAYGGVQQPINADGDSIFKLGTTIPVKFQLKDGVGTLITNAVASIASAKVSNNILGDDVETTSTAAASSGNLFRYDATALQYIFNWSTKGLTKGTYQVKIILDDGASYVTIVSLK
jgi:hypothetical protein